MRVLVAGLLLFALALAAHLALWRLRQPRRHTRALLRIFFGTLAAGALAGPRLAGAAPLTPAEALHLFVFFTALALSYIVIYSALQVDSPSLSIVLAIAGAGDRGLAREQLQRDLTDERLVRPRLEDLVRDAAVVCRDGVYRLRGRGGLFVGLIIAWRRLMGLPVRGG